MRACQTKRREEKRESETSGPLAPLLICFSLPLGLVYVNWTGQECCLFYPMSLLWSSDLPFFYFHGLFPSLSKEGREYHHHSGLLFPILTT